MTDGTRRNGLGMFGAPLASGTQRGLGYPGGPPKSTSSYMDEIIRALATPPKEESLSEVLARLCTPSAPPPPTVGLGNFLGALESLAPQPQRNALADIFGSHSLPTMPAPSPSPEPIRRKVFFSFHYDDVCRTVQVRQSWRFRRGWTDPSDNFYDKSLWEKSRTENEDYLKRIIRRAMAGSTVTCVLAGSETWERPYVRFEIAHSLMKGNGLFTVAIHDVRHPQKGTSSPGYNPLSFMGLELQPDGKGRVVEWINGGWDYFNLMKAAVPWPRWLPKPTVGRLNALSVGTAAYDYVRDEGYKNLPQWAQYAADAAVRR